MYVAIDLRLSRLSNRYQCDFGGVVSKLGKGVSNVKVGDSVAGFVHGGKYTETGAFSDLILAELVTVQEEKSEYVSPALISSADLLWKIPSTTTFEEAAAIGGIGCETAYMASDFVAGPYESAYTTESQALCMRLKLPEPDSGSSTDHTVLIWSGATSVGQYAIQIAKVKRQSQ